MGNGVWRTNNGVRGIIPVYVIVLVIAVIVVAGAVMYSWPQNRRQPEQPLNTAELRTDALTDSRQACNNYFDCRLLACSGCFANTYLQTAPPDLACRTYAEGFVCSCVNNRCQTVSAAEATKEYASSRFGFIVRYPKGWEVVEASDGADFGVPIEEAGVTRVSNGFSINVYPQTGSEALSAAYERVAGIDLESIPFVKPENMIIAGELAIMLRGVPGEISSDDVILAKNKKLFLIQIFDMTAEHKTAMLESIAFSAPGD